MARMRRSGRRRRGGRIFPKVWFFQEGFDHVARVNPGEFLRQVRSESAKIVWPTRKETFVTGVMVVIMTVLLAAFFFGVDFIFGAIVHQLLALLS
jgi:preprotein translocase subunit SecE